MQTELARFLGISRARVNQMLPLLKLPTKSLLNHEEHEVHEEI